MFYYLYQITNLVNNKIYVGVHKTHDMNDGYMGSGIVIKMAIEKHGIDNFRKDILEIFENQESMYAREKGIVTEEFLAREDVYNLRRGGTGGWDYINKYKLNLWNGIGKRPGTIKNYFTKESAIIVNNHNKENKKGIYSPNFDHPFRKKEVQLENAKKANTKEAREKRANTRKEIKFQQGANNSQFGTMWITNEVENKKIKKDAITPEGWRKGRI
jgi:hypothetical protein